MSRISEYDKFPVIPVQSAINCAWQGWSSIVEHIRGQVSKGARRLAIECYPGVFEDEISAAFSEALMPVEVVRVRDSYKSPRDIEAMTARELTEDPVFGRMNGFVIKDFLDPVRTESLRQQLRNPDGVTVVIGTGTSLIEPNPDILIYADLPRWEIQQRQRSNKIFNLALENRHESASLRYKRGYFLDWRMADRIKKELLSKMDFL
ncbi:MAG TPA: hypothetical protein VK639_21525, partial [Terriglobales bacterium]|nr:hypothetical protein [Terriglobales bacterium]